MRIEIGQLVDSQCFKRYGKIAVANDPALVCDAILIAEPLRQMVPNNLGTSGERVTAAWNRKRNSAKGILKAKPTTHWIFRREDRCTNVLRRVFINIFRRCRGAVRGVNFYFEAIVFFEHLHDGFR